MLLQIICTCLLRCVEWMRCVLNQFCSPSDLPTEEWYKLLLRFNQLITAEDELYSHCQRYPPFVQLVAPNVKVGSYNTSTGKRVSGKKKASSGTSTATATSFMDQLLILEDITLAMETLLKPLVPEVCCLLGFGTEPLMYSTAPMMTQTQSMMDETSESMPPSAGIDSNSAPSTTGIVKLTEAAQLRLLEHLSARFEIANYLTFLLQHDDNMFLLHPFIFFNV